MGSLLSALSNYRDSLDVLEKTHHKGNNLLTEGQYYHFSVLRKTCLCF